MLGLKRVRRALLQFCLGLAIPVLAQQPSGNVVLSGTVADQTGAKIAHAHISLEGRAAKRDIATNGIGEFAIGLPPGTYAMTISSEGFEPFRKSGIELKTGQEEKLFVTLNVAAHEEQLTVASDGASSATDPNNNLNALRFQGKDLDLFSDDNDTFLRELMALAGSNGSAPLQLYIDGFSAGRLPPKKILREVRINHNPLSAEFDRFGSDRVEVFTKPGQTTLHGDLSLEFNNQDLNARNPYAGTAKPPFQKFVEDGNLSGPLGRKTSFFIAANRSDRDNTGVSNAFILNSENQAVPVTNTVPNPQLNNAYSFRLDRQLTRSDIFTGRLEYYSSAVHNDGLGPLTLSSATDGNDLATQTLQLGDTHIFSPKAVLEARFQYMRTRSRQLPVNTEFALDVEGYFHGGGSPNQALDEHQDEYEFQDYFSRSYRKHLLRVGMRYRFRRLANSSTANFNGQYIFPDISTYAITVAGLQQGLSGAAIRALGGGASQFSVTLGNSSASVSSGDLGAFAEDTWQIRKNLSLTAGVRIESETAIPDHFDPAPRIGLAWALQRKTSKTPFLVIRPGFGVFYNRIDLQALLQTVRQNGTTQQTYYATNPDFYPDVPSRASLQSPEFASLFSAPPSIYELDPNFRTQYELVGTISAEHSFGRYGSVSATYSAYHGLHEYLTRNANAPLPGTYSSNDPTSGIRPLGTIQNVYEIASNGDGHQKFFSSTFTFNPVKRLQITGFYVEQRHLTDTEGPTSMVSNSYDVHQDYGRADTDAERRVIAFGQYTFPYNFSIVSSVNYHTGLPYNVVIGNDLNGDSFYNDRPAFATDLSRPSVRFTPLGAFDTAPTPQQQIIPFGYGQSPSVVYVNAALNTGIRIGKRNPLPASNGLPATNGDRRYLLGLTADVENLFNHMNAGVPVGTISPCEVSVASCQVTNGYDPLFGQSISLADRTRNTSANRIINLRAFITF